MFTQKGEVEINPQRRQVGRLPLLSVFSGSTQLYKIILCISSCSCDLCGEGLREDHGLGVEYLLGMQDILKLVPGSSS